MSQAFRMYKVGTYGEVRIGNEVGLFCWGKINSEVGELDLLCVRLPGGVARIPAWKEVAITMNNGMFVWDWNGNKDRPTFSRLMSSGYGWEGYISRGLHY